MITYDYVLLFQYSNFVVTTRRITNNPVINTLWESECKVLL